MYRAYSVWIKNDGNNTVAYGKYFFFKRVEQIKNKTKGSSSKYKYLSLLQSRSSLCPYAAIFLVKGLGSAFTKSCSSLLAFTSVPPCAYFLFIIAQQLGIVYFHYLWFVDNIFYYGWYSTCFPAFFPSRMLSAYCPGETPAYFLKIRIKLLVELQPTRSAKSLILTSSCRKISLAFSILYWLK